MTETRLVAFGDIVEDNGKTIRENNEAIGHNIPVGTLVEVKYDDWHGDGCCEKVHARLWVVKHSRDCDGSPLYILSRWKDWEFALAIRDYKNGFGERSLTPVEVTLELQRGDSALTWDDDEPTPPQEPAQPSEG